MSQTVKRKPLNDAERYRVLRRANFRCQFCGSPAGEVRLEVDHLYPVSKGGGNEDWNLAAVCRRCNSGKRALEDYEFNCRYHRLCTFEFIYKTNRDPFSKALRDLAFEFFGDLRVWVDGLADDPGLCEQFSRRERELEALYETGAIQ